MKPNLHVPYFISTIKPPGFSPCVEVAACYVVSQGKLLLLQRAEGKVEENTWGAPGGKVEKGESVRQAVIRETLEEVGITLDERVLLYLGELFIRKGESDFIYHMFHQEFASIPQVALNHEHSNYRWVSYAEAQDLPLIPAGSEALDHFYACISRKQA